MRHFNEIHKTPGVFIGMEKVHEVECKDTIQMNVYGIPVYTGTVLT